MFLRCSAEFDPIAAEDAGASRMCRNVQHMCLDKGVHYMLPMRNVSGNIYLIEGPKQGRYPYSDLLYIDDRIQTLVDTGIGRAVRESLRDKKIDLIINSHFHLDHRANNNAFPGAQVWAHRLDAPAIRNSESFLEHIGISKVSNGAIEPKVSDIPESPVHHEFEDNQLIRLGETELRVIHTPGHTPGHCSFFCEKEGVLYGGDIDLSGFGPFYGNITSDIDDFIGSIRKLRDLNPKAFISAHKGLIEEDIPGCLDRYLSHIYRREARILDSLATPGTLEQLTLLKPISGSWAEPDEMYYQIEMIGVYNHLKRLIAAGSVIKDGDYYVRV